MITYRILDADADEFPGWVGIACLVDGVVQSTSWAPADVLVGARLNMDYPEAFDERTGQTIAWCMPDATSAEWMGLTEDGVDALRALAAEKGLL